MNSIAESKTISEAFLRRAKAEPNKIGFSFKKEGEWKNVSFGEQFETVRRLSCGLMQLGVEKGNTVCILGQTSINWSQFDLAILGCAGITVPVYPTNTPQDTQYIINHCEASIIFVDDFKNLLKLAAISKDCPKLKKIIVNFDVRQGDVQAKFEIMQWSALYDLGLNQEKAMALKFENNLTNAKPSDLFTICYTSGTTGLPKGVMLPHSSMSSVMQDVQKVIVNATSNDERLLTFLPMSHIFGKWESMTPHYLGWTNCFAESIDSLVANLSEVQPTLWIAVPRIFEKVYSKIMMQVEEGSAVKRALFNWAIGVGRKYIDVKYSGESPSLALTAQYELAKSLVFSKVTSKFGGKLKFCVSGSAPLAKNIQEFMHAVGVPVFEGYGLTETCAPICVNLPSANRFGTVGKLFPEVLVKIANDGEILIKSAKNFSGYFKNPEATAEAIKDGWFYSGDIGHIDEDGYLLITDRKKDLIKTAGGKYIAPQKIENLAKKFQVLSQIVLYGDQKPFASALITLNQDYVMQYAQSNKIIFSDYAELIKNSEIQKIVADTIEQLNAQLARYETIKRYLVLPREFTVEDGELTPSMKVKRKFLTQKYQTELEALYR